MKSGKPNLAHRHIPTSGSSGSIANVYNDCNDTVGSMVGKVWFITEFEITLYILHRSTASSGQTNTRRILWVDR